jgi:hypothetical protein
MYSGYDAPLPFPGSHHRGEGSGSSVTFTGSEWPPPKNESEADISYRDVPNNPLAREPGVRRSEAYQDLGMSI